MFSLASIERLVWSWRDRFHTRCLRHYSRARHNASDPRAARSWAQCWKALCGGLHRPKLEHNRTRRSLPLDWVGTSELCQELHFCIWAISSSSLVDFRWPCIQGSQSSHCRIPVPYAELCFALLVDLQLYSLACVWCNAALLFWVWAVLRVDSGPRGSFWTYVWLHCDISRTTNVEVLGICASNEHLSKQEYHCLTCHTSYLWVDLSIYVQWSFCLLTVCSDALGAAVWERTQVELPKSSNRLIRVSLVIQFLIPLHF